MNRLGEFWRQRGTRGKVLIREVGMVRRSPLAVVIGAIVTVLAVGCAGGSSDSIKVVKDFYAAVNANDVDKAMTLVADDAVFVNPLGTFRGAEEVRGFLVRSGSVTFEHNNFRATGGRVVYDFKVKDDVYGRVIAKGTDGLTIVDDGKIVYDGTERTEQGR
jgi:limonene-1,2-epoxide hydrolase